MIFRNHLRNSLEEDFEFHEYSSSETDSSCHSLFNCSNEMTDSGVFDVLITTEPIKDQNNQTDYSSGENIYVTESCSSTTKQENQTLHSISAYAQEINETQCHDVMTQGISPIDPTNNSECSSVLSGNTGLYAGSGEEYNSIQQASPDSQQSYFLNPDGKIVNLFLNGTPCFIFPSTE